MGFTDGFGCFNIGRSGGMHRLEFIVYQPIFNLRGLYYIKRQLGYGKILKYESKGLACFIITEIKVLNQVIFPIFDKYPLLTKKYFSYLEFKNVYYNLENFKFSRGLVPQNKEMTNKLSKQLVSHNQECPAISQLNENSDYFEIKSVILESWLIGFIEAVGNFLIFPSVSHNHPTKTMGSEMYKGFEIEFRIASSQDPFLLYLIKCILHIPNKVNYDKDTSMYLLKTKNSRSISNVINAFSNKFIGMKALEFKLWSKAYYYKDKNIKKTNKIYSIFLKIQKKNMVFVQKRHFSVVTNSSFKVVRSTKLLYSVKSAHLAIGVRRDNKVEQFGIFSNIFIRSYCKVSMLHTEVPQKGSSSLNPYYVTGFSDGEACFFITYQRHSECSTG